MKNNAINNKLSLNDDDSCPVWIRLFSLCYDLILLIAWIITASFALFAFSPDLLNNPDKHRLIIQIFCLVCLLLYFLISWNKGQTLGMRAWRLKYQYPLQHPITLHITLHKSLTNHISPKLMSILLRLVLSLTLMFFWGLLWSIFRNDRKSLLDMLSGSDILRYSKNS